MLIDMLDFEFGVKFCVVVFGVFWDDWALELDFLKNKIDDGLDIINDFKNDFIEDIYGIGNVIVFFVGDFVDFGLKFVDLVYDEVLVVVSNVNVFMNGFS